MALKSFNMELSSRQVIVCTYVPQVMHPDLLNVNFRNAEYAVRGELYLKGAELKKAGRDIIFTNGKLVCCALRAACCLHLTAAGIYKKGIFSIHLSACACSGQSSAAGPEAIDLQQTGSATIPEGSLPLSVSPSFELPTFEF